MKKRDDCKQKAKDFAVNGVVSDEHKEAWNEFKKLRNAVNNRKKSDERNYKKEKINATANNPIA